MLNLVFIFLQLNKKTPFTQSILHIYKMNEYILVVLIKIFDINKKNENDRFKRFWIT